MSVIHLLRHGTAHKGPGQDPADLFSTADQGLSPEGRMEAEGAARTLADEPLQAVYASSTRRAQETAAIVATKHGLDVLTDDRVIEVSFGRSGDGYRAMLQAILDMPHRFEADPDPMFPNGERHSAVVARGMAALDDVANAHDVAAVVAHGLFNRFVLTHVTGADPGRMLALDQGHACINTLERVDGQWKVRRVDHPPGAPL